MVKKKKYVIINLFRGRGEHPKMGMCQRIKPEDVILNIGKNVAIPPCPIDEHKRCRIIHDSTVTYIAKWIENINGQHKFVYLMPSSLYVVIFFVFCWFVCVCINICIGCIRHCHCFCFVLFFLFDLISEV